MSKLILTKFIKTTQQDIKPYEQSGMPKIGENVFVYEGKTEIDIANKNVIMKAMGWSKLNKINNLTSTQTKAMSKNGTADFNDSRTLALEKAYDELADQFLKLLHEATWTHYGKIGAVEKYILSTIDFDEVYDSIKMVIESLELLKIKIVNDKFNEKYSSIEIENAMKQKSLDIQQVVGKLKK